MTSAAGLASRRKVTGGVPGNGGDCVEVARTLSRVVAVRDSKYPSGPVLLVSLADWVSFTARLRTV
jgi:hypothetical protein